MHVYYDNWKNRIVNFVIIVVTGLAALACLFPIMHCIALSFSSAAAVSAGEVSVWPVGFNLLGYQTLLKEKQFFVSFGISVVRTGVGWLVGIILTVLMAYPLSKDKKEFPQRGIYIWYIIFTMLFGGGTIPTYIIINKYGLLNNFWVLILPMAVSTGNVIMMMNFFRGIPKELEEAAIMDGATPLHTLFKIYLPISLPSIATISLFIILGHWNSYFDGIIYMSDVHKYPLQSYIQQFVVKMPDTTKMTAEEIAKAALLNNRNLNAAKIVITMVPILCIYPFMQKYFTKGLVMGAVKE